MSNIVFSLLILLMLAVGTVAFMPLVTRAENYGYVQAYSNDFPDTFYSYDYGGSREARNPVPKIYYIDPSSATARNASLEITISGGNFMPASRANFDGASRNTSFRSTSKLSMVLAPSDLSYVGGHTITVVNPGPGGGTSNEKYFVVEAPARGAVLGASTTRNTSPTYYGDGSVAGDAQEIRNLTASALYGNGVLPSSLIGWISLAILVLAVVIIVRKILGLEHKFHASPLKHS